MDSNSLISSGVQIASSLTISHAEFVDFAQGERRFPIHRTVKDKQVCF